MLRIVHDSLYFSKNSCLKLEPQHQENQRGQAEYELPHEASFSTEFKCGRVL